MKKIFANSAVRKSAALIRDVFLGLTFPFSLPAIFYMAPMGTSSWSMMGKRFARPLALGGGLSLAFNAALNNALPTAEDYLADLGVPGKTVRDLTGGVPTRINDGSTWVGRVYGQYNKFLSEHDWAISMTKNLVFLPDQGSGLRGDIGYAESALIDWAGPNGPEETLIRGLRWKIKKKLGLKQQCDIGLSLGPEEGTALRMSASHAQVLEEAIDEKALSFSDREIRLEVIFHELAHCSPENQKMELGPESETNADIKALKAQQDVTGKDLRHALVLLRAFNIPQYDPGHEIANGLQTWAKTGKILTSKELEEKKEEYESLLKERLKNVNNGNIGRYDENGKAILFHDLIYPQICAFMKEGHPPSSLTERAQLYLKAVETYLLPDGKTAPCDLSPPPEPGNAQPKPSLEMC